MQFRRSLFRVLVPLVLASGIASAQGRGGQAPSPASQRPPRTVTPQTYDAAVIRRGEARFVAQCASCHGRDAAGGETGSDLTRSTLVAEDMRGDKIGPFLAVGRPDKGMPLFKLSADDLAAIVAFVHDQKAAAELLGGGRRNVDPEDLRTGNAEAGRQYFNGAGNCSKCHSPAGDLAGVGTRFQGLALLQRMLNPAGSRPAPKPAKVTVTLQSGEAVAGSLAARDEFTIAITDASGMRRSWPANEVKVAIDNPVATHFDQLGKYTDADMHNVFAYLETLR